MIQFHQSYSYEDFIRGYRPVSDGGFELINGVFYKFCEKAKRDSQRNYIFIIDEINRGNLSKIFGELLLLIEPTKRGKEYAVNLTYMKNNDEKFYVPDNVFIIGTMNTADRSLSIVDYALRRRFIFINLQSQIKSDKFKAFLLKKGLSKDLINRITTRILALNEIIVKDKKFLGNGYEIGHSYFCPPRNVDILETTWFERVILLKLDLCWKNIGMMNWIKQTTRYRKF